MKISVSPKLQCDLLLESVTYDLPGPAYVSLMAKVKKPQPKAEILSLISDTLPAAPAEEIFNDLLENHVLVNDHYNLEEMKGVEHWINRGWIEGLILHLKTRNISFSDTRGDAAFSTRAALEDVIAREGLPDIWKHYESAETVNLLSPEPMPDKSLEEVLLKRRSNRPWRHETMSLADLSSILHHANIEGCRVRTELEQSVGENPELLLNSSFTALETYCLVLSVESIKPGLYHYNMKNHELELIREGLFRDEITKCCIGQSRPHGASCIFMISAVWDRFMYRYRHPRAYRTLLTNVAELGHKYLLLGTSLRLSTFMTPAFNDKYVDDFMGFNGYDEAVLYAIGLG